MMTRRSIEVWLYTRPGCGPCEEATALIRESAGSFPLTLHVIDVDTDPVLRDEFGADIPVVEIRVGDRKRTLRHTLRQDEFEMELERLCNT